MKISLAEKRQIENEMIFRRINEKVGTDLDALDAMHREDGNHHLVRDDDVELHFQCECADENCDVRIPVKLSVYRQIHLNRNAFIVKLRHHVDKIEDILLSNAHYSIVQKKNSTAEPNDVLKVTTIDNSMHK